MSETGKRKDGDAFGPEAGPHDAGETRRRLEGYLAAYPGLRGRVCRILLLQLHSEGLVQIDEVYRRAERAEKWNAPVDPNVPQARLWAADEKELINTLVLDLATKHLAPDKVDELVWAAHRRDEAQSLESLARMPGVPLELIAEKVSQYTSLPRSAGPDAKPFETPVGTKVALIRRFVSDRVDYIAVAKRHLRMQDFAWVLERCVGTERGAGMIGGKAAGMVLAHAVLASDEECGEVALPNTVFVLTDAYDEFKDINGLGHLQDHKYREIRRVKGDFRAIREVFGNAEFPARVADLLRIELDRWGERPLIVRSSSLLEDSFGAAFSGIYQSLFLANQGPLEERLENLLGAIADIYAGVFSPDAVAYRRRHGLLDHDERMGVMIQEVVGTRHGPYYLPAVAGVAFSRNDYRWNRRIRREDGLVRMVLGLGTHAVDRVGDYARMVPLEHPSLRPEGTPEEIAEASQKKADVVDMTGVPGFRNVPVREVLAVMDDKAYADLVSILDDGRLALPVGKRVSADPEQLVVTFERLLTRGDFAGRMRRILRRLEDAYDTPVDVEFVMDHGPFTILQCRPLGGESYTHEETVPTGVAADDKVFSARRYVNSGHLEAIEYLILIDPRDYGALDSVDARLEVARAVGRVNDLLAGSTFVLMGPGRWGSQDLRLGVQVTYSDIDHASALVEIARRTEGYTPEPSFGTHFFQELIEARILYLPLYPDDDGAVFNEEFFAQAPNDLAAICPEYEYLESVVRVIDLKKARPGKTLKLVMDGEAQEALCWFA